VIYAKGGVTVTTRATWSYGEGSPDGVIGYGGFTDVARALTAATPDQPVSRQLVYTWHRRRDTTGFPERRDVKMPNGTVKRLFDLGEALAWHHENRASVA